MSRPETTPPRDPSSSPDLARKPQRSVDTELTIWTWLYDMVVWFFMVVFDCFFREVKPRGAFKIPRQGPVIFVAAPHANQFIDPMLLMRVIRNEAGRRISFLVAEHSTRRKFIGFMARCTASIPVMRPQDNLKLASGRIFVRDPSNPLKISGEGTKFTQDCMLRGLIGLPNYIGNAEIAEIISDTELVLKNEFKSSKAVKVLKEGTTFKAADHVDQSTVYNKVFDQLCNGACVGIFPEGGSHDRTDLLPLKAGVAVMALGALAKYPDCDVKVVPCGMNYFHPHKFRSRAVIEFGTPITISKDLVNNYLEGGESKRKAVRNLLAIITDSLKTVTVTCPDYETLMSIQAVRRLYKPVNKRIPIPLVVELNRRLINGYANYKDDSRITRVRESVAHYNVMLEQLGIKDHQVEKASLSSHVIVGKLIFRSLKLTMLLMGALPGIVLFAPVFVATKRISTKKAAEALKGSTVKIKANDVLATWKILVAMGVAPLLYSSYALLTTWIVWRYKLIPTFRPLFMVFFVAYLIFFSITYAALLIGETGMDIFKSLRPLALSLIPSHKNALQQLKKTRESLVVDVTEMVNTIGPELYPNFDQATADAAEVNEEEEEAETYRLLRRRRGHKSRHDDSSGSISSMSSLISKDSLSNAEFFASSDGETTSGGSSGIYSRSSSMSSVSSLGDGSGGKPEISRTLRGAMEELRRERQLSDDEN
ncbi:hypothetical protein NADFUDRAFT_48230 [Nadsonia fulvescens var. elongata DSM 6958]|uniref:Phospholipid/glycerol acyltransferase domain-containing protein n=1 Tax=Nadsonia fulvescens var. elongata DSM 6958 TaxID=857566 RepID=A0A1E3PD80_9ASCO|nr:hypothetical protein NADFUDRAFT_48230 [Nadsonia fulvescens var. elongata DSM 6958]